MKRKKNATQSVKNVVEKGEDRRDVSRAVDETLLLYTSSSDNEEREQISVSIATSGVRQSDYGSRAASLRPDT
jgi:hypothetical protein